MNLIVNLKKTSIRTKILLGIGFSFLVSMLLLMVVVIDQFENLRIDSQSALSEELLKQKKDKYKVLAQTREEILSQIYLMNKDDLSDDEIKGIFSEVNSGSKLDNNYFFIYTLEGDTISLPPTPQLEGTNRWELEVEGRYLLKELSQVAREGGGEIDYPYTNPRTGEVETKFGYIEPIYGTDFFIGIGGYESSFHTVLDKVELKILDIRGEVIHLLIVLFSVVIIIVLLMINWISNYIENNIKFLIDGFRRVSSGQIDFKLDNRCDDEFFELISGFNYMLEQITSLTYNDPLTGLPNTKFLYNRLKNDIDDLAILEENKYIFTLGLRKFNLVNSNYGYKSGDGILKKVSSRLVDSLGDDVIIARNDNEFIFYYKTSLSKEKVLELGNKLLKKLLNPYTVDNKLIYLEPQLGISCVEAESIGYEELIKESKMALHFVYNDKSDILFYRRDMKHKLSSRVDLESRIRRAIAKEEFLLYYQPIVNIKREKTIGLEALIRWDDPEEGMVYPDQFIPVAESADLMVPLGNWVLKKSCEKLKSLEEEGYDDIFISVNISPKEFLHPYFFQKIERMIAKSGINPENLKLEITERTTVEDVEYTVEMLNKLRGLGIKIAIDDFGTGYSSLEYLSRFSIDTLKIDKTFIQNEGSQEIVKVIIMMSHNLSLEVIAEGVETQEELKFLLDNKCFMSQGYLFSRPMESQKVIKFVEGYNKS